MHASLLTPRYVSVLHFQLCCSSRAVQSTIISVRVIRYRNPLQPIQLLQSTRLSSDTKVSIRTWIKCSAVFANVALAAVINGTELEEDSELVVFVVSEAFLLPKHFSSPIIEFLHSLFNTFATLSFQFCLSHACSRPLAFVFILYPIRAYNLYT